MTLLDGRFSGGQAVRIAISRLITFVMAIMVVGFLLSIALAVTYSFKKTTSTHCQVPNYLPSISAAIAVPPSSYVWRFVIVLCAGQRLFLVSFHYSFYSSVSTSVSYYPLLCKICFLCEMLENFALIGLTCVSSSENFPIHEKMFILFQAGAMVFMLLMCYIHKLAINSGYPSTKSERRTLKNLMIFSGANFASFFTAIYFYFRHERLCEPGIYTLFAFFEYMVVLTNIAFHYIVTYNFQERELVLGGRMYDE